jgi:hypothetical protein
MGVVDITNGLSLWTTKTREYINDEWVVGWVFGGIPDMPLN